MAIRSATAKSKSALLPDEDEDAIHFAVADFLRLAWPTDLEWLHVPNGEERVSYERVDRKTGRTYRYSPAGQKLRRMGLRPGAYDLWFQLPKGKYGWIELKTKTGVTSDEQDDFGDRIEAHGGGRAVARSVEDVERILTGWLKLFGLELRARTIQRAPQAPVVTA